MLDRNPKILNKCQHIILILDESSSMSDQKNDVITGVNQMLREQQKVDPKNNHRIRFTLVKFSHHVKNSIDTNLELVRPISNFDYHPNGSTALYDAIGKTLQRFSREERVVCCIATDGQENASRNYNFKQIVNLIGHHEEHNNWNFVYLSEGLDTFEQGNQIGINNNTKRCYKSDGSSSMAQAKYNQVLSKGGIGKYIGSNSCNLAIAEFRNQGFSETVMKSKKQPNIFQSSNNQSNLASRPWFGWGSK